MLVLYENYGILVAIITTNSTNHPKGAHFMKRIDLHVHSSISDGTMTPTEVVELAIKKQLAAIALTDHDTVDGVAEAIEAAERLATSDYKLQVIPGTELSAGYKGEDIHILGLFLDHTNPKLRAILADVAKEREQRNHKMCTNLQKAGIDISVEKLRNGKEDVILTRAHFAKYLLEHGYISTMREAFDTYLNSKGPYYVAREFLSPKQCIELIQEAGGVPILAHPLLYKLSNNELEKLIRELVSYGLKGIEAIYSCNRDNDESYVKGLAHKYNLLITGGSDFHGSVKPEIDLGSGRGKLCVPADLLEQFALNNS